MERASHTQCSPESIKVSLLVPQLHSLSRWNNGEALSRVVRRVYFVDSELGKIVTLPPNISVRLGNPPIGMPMCQGGIPP